MTRPTRVVHSHNEHGADLYAFGHLSTIRKADKIRLTVNTSATQAFTTPPLAPQEAIFAADLLRAASANTGGGACAGKSIIEMLWDTLDTLIDLLMDEDPQPDPDLLKGKAEGVAYALAVFQNPYLPNLDAIRQQAMERWEANNA